MVVPALLTDKKEELIRMVDLCSEFTDYVQIDVMDGEFVPSKSIGPYDLEGCELKAGCEAHLMAVDPFVWLEPFKKVGAQRIIYHFEIKKDHLSVISKIKELNLSVGLAINPSTEIKDFETLVTEVDSVLFMSVEPGFYGAPFMPQVLDKIKTFKDKYPEVIVGIDGGVKYDNLLQIKSSGVDYVCVGSAILKSSNPKQAYEEFVKLFNG